VKLREKYFSTKGIIELVKSLLLTTSFPEFVIESLPSILFCSSQDFFYLKDTFLKMYEGNLSIGKDLIRALMTFDLDSKMKKEAFNISLVFLDSFDSEELSGLISFSYYCADSSNVSEFFVKMRYILDFSQKEEVYLSFEHGSNRFLKQMIKTISDNSDWEIYDYYLFLIGTNHFQTQNKMHKLFWDSASYQRKLFENIINYLNSSKFACMQHLIYHHMNFIKYILFNPPEYLHLSIERSVSDILISIYHSFSTYSRIIFSEIFGFMVTKTGFILSICSDTILKLPSSVLLPHLPILDESISQIGNSKIQSLHLMCSLISLIAQENNSNVIISLQKRLFHHSQNYIHAGIITAFHMIRNGFIESDQLFIWVVKAFKQNYLLMKTSLVRSFLDIVKICIRPQFFIKVFSVLYLLMNHYNILSPAKKKTIISFSNHPQFCINFQNVSHSNEGSIYGDILLQMSLLLNSQGFYSLITQKPKYSNDCFLLNIKDLSSLGICIPGFFHAYIKEGKAETKLTNSNIESLVTIQTFFYPLIEYYGIQCPIVQYYISIIESINCFFGLHGIHKMDDHYWHNYECFSPMFSLSLLMHFDFSFPRDIALLVIVVNNLYSLFIKSNCNYRFWFTSKSMFLDNRVNSDLIIRALSVCHNMLSESTKIDILKNKSVFIENINLCCRIFDLIITFSGYSKNVLLFDELVSPLFEYVNDVGLACRIIIFGYHIGIEQAKLFEIACFFSMKKMISDLCSDPHIFPLGIPCIREIIKPNEPGFNWRLILFLSLQTNEFEKFYPQINTLIEQIEAREIAEEMVFVLCQIFEGKVSLFYNDFDECVEVSIRIIQRMLIPSIETLTKVSSLTAKIIEIQKRTGFTSAKVANLQVIIRKGLNRINIQSKIVSHLSVLCEDLVIYPNSNTEYDLSGMFNVQSSDDDDFSMDEDSECV